MMSRQSEIKRISDFYKVIKSRYGSYWQVGKPSEQFQDKLSTAYIDQLLRLEIHAINISWGSQPNFDEYEKFRQKNDQDKIKQFEDYYHQLKLLEAASPKFVLPSKCVGICLAIWGENYRGLQVLKRRSISLWNLKEILTRQNQRIYQELSKPHFLQLKNSEEQQVQARTQDALSYLDQCFSISESLDVLCIEIGYPSILSKVAEGDPKNLGLLKGAYASFRDWLDQQSEIVGYLQQPFFSPSKGGSVQFVFFLKPSNEFNEIHIGRWLGQAWVDATWKLGSYYNFNPEIWSFSKQAVGLIKKSQKTKIKNLKYWVIDYFSHLPLYLKIQASHPLHDIPLTGKKPIHIQLPLSYSSEVKLINKSTLQLSTTTKNRLWRVPRDGKIANQRILLQQIWQIYQEVNCTALALPITPVNLQSLCIDIESFMVFARCDRTSIFSDRYDSAVINYSKYMCQKGWQLFYLFQQIQTLSLAKLAQLPLLKYLSINILVFIYTLYETCAHKGKVPVNITTDQEIVCFINAWFDRIDSILQQQASVLIQTLLVGEEQQSVGTDYFQTAHVKSLLKKRVDNIQKTERLKKPETSAQSTEDKTNYPPKLYQLINLRQTVAEKTYQEAKQYTQAIFRQDVHVCSYKIQMPWPVNSEQEFKVFSMLLTEFLSMLQKEDNLPKRRGYVARWEFDSIGHCYSRMIFFIPVQQIYKFDQNIFLSSLNKLWRISLESASSDEANANNDTSQQLIEAIPIFEALTDFNTSYCLVMSKDKKKQHQFNSQVLCYLVKQGQYIHHDSITFPKGFFKGQERSISPGTKPKKQATQEKPQAAQSLDSSTEQIAGHSSIEECPASTVENENTAINLIPIPINHNEKTRKDMGSSLLSFMKSRQQS